MEPPQQVSEEFWHRLNHAIATVQFAHAGLRSLRSEYEAISPPAENPDPNCFIGHGDPNDPASRAFASWKLSELLAHTDRGGDAHVRLDRQWIVSFFQEWEEDIRPRLARSLKVSKSEVVEPTMGDLRRFRHDVIHNKGVASSRYSARAEVLHWFSEGDEIALTDQHYLEFLDAVGVVARWRLPAEHRE